MISPIFLTFLPWDNPTLDTNSELTHLKLVQIRFSENTVYFSAVIAFIYPRLGQWEEKKRCT